MHPVPTLLLLATLLGTSRAQQITSVSGSENAGEVTFATSAPDTYGVARLMWIKINGVLVENIPLNGIQLPGTNGTTKVPMPGIRQGDTIEVAVTFDLADGSGGTSTIASGTCQQ